MDNRRGEFALYICAVLQPYTPGEFIHSVEYTDPEAPFRPVSSFDKYRLGRCSEGNYVYIIPATEAGPDKLRIIYRFGN